MSQDPNGAPGPSETEAKSSEAIAKVQPEALLPPSATDMKAMQEEILSLKRQIEMLGQDVAEVSMTRERIAGLRWAILNLGNIYLRTGNHEVRVAVKETARALCFVIGEQHKLFFPDGPTKIVPSEPNAALMLPGTPGQGYAAAAEHSGMPAATAATHMPSPAPGISVPGVAPSPYAGPPAVNPQAAAHPVAGSPAGGFDQSAGQGSAMVVVSDPSGQMGPGGGPPPGTPAGVYVPATPGPAMPPAGGQPVHPAGFPPIPAPPSPQIMPPGVHPQPGPGVQQPVTLDELAGQFQPMGPEQQK